MADDTIVRKKDWVLTQEAFDRLLAWLAAEPERAGQQYEEIRRKLIVFFTRRNCQEPEELADDTLNRVARRIVEEEKIQAEMEPLVYCYRMARLVFQESLRNLKRGPVALDELSPSGLPTDDPAERAAREAERREREQRLECLGRCTRDLPPETRELIVRYYQGEQGEKIANRKALAARLQITVNALSIRACRIREKLEACVLNCLRAPQMK